MELEGLQMARVKRMRCPDFGLNDIIVRFDVEKKYVQWARVPHCYGLHEPKLHFGNTGGHAGTQTTVRWILKCLHVHSSVRFRVKTVCEDCREPKLRG